MAISFPRLSARTLRFTLGIARNTQVSADGSTVWFIRTPDGVSRTGQLWAFDVARGTEQRIVDPATLQDADEELSPQEQARRERSRESGSGLIGYDVDDAGCTAVFALSGELWTTDLRTNHTRKLPATGPVLDPRIDPSGAHIAYCHDRELRVIAADGSDDRALAQPDTHTQVWGQAEFIAAEELYRHRGFWWSPDGQRLIVERFDEAPVQLWYIADASEPHRPPVRLRYPAAGTSNADIGLYVVDLAGQRTVIDWDAESYEYVHHVSWTSHGDPVVQVLSRDHRSSQILTVNPDTGSTQVIRRLVDDSWVESLATAPQFGPGGSMVHLEDVANKRRILVDGSAISNDAWQIRSIISVTADSVVATASAEPTEVQVVRFGVDGTATPLTSGAAVHGAVYGGGTIVVSRSGLTEPTTTHDVFFAAELPGAELPGPESRRRIRSVAEPAPFTPHVEFLSAGDHGVRTAVLFPRGHVSGEHPLPLLLDPYGGPHAQRALASARAFLEPQWLADQGFCVVVADGRGTPGRDYAWERAVKNSFATVTLDDQVAAVEAVAQRFPHDVDPGRVGITGWSYGGYLAALAVLQRPDVFHAAVAGAPVTDWRLYDTAYTERYLGNPHAQPAVYAANSLIDLAPRLERPLMLIHGLADDNVVAAHTLRLSAALLEAGRPHTMLPLSGVTHMASSETVAENLKLLQVQFLQRSLPAGPAAS